MKKLALLLALFSVFLSLLPAPPREDLWKKVNDADKKGLPKTAIKHLKEIEKVTLEKKAYGEHIKAFTKRINTEGSIQGNKPEERIIRLQKEAVNVPIEVRPVINAVLANWYWHYFQRNRWRFMQRTQTSEPPSDDFQTWDLARILEETGKQFDKALSAAPQLKKIPVAQYDSLLTKPNNIPDSYRPTLFDFIAFEAIKFYQTGEQAANKSQFAFEISANSPVLDDVDAFLQWKPKTEDERSPLLRAIQVYQDLLLFHRNDDSPDALADADLHRLKFANSHAFGEEKNSRYKAALERFYKRWADHKISTRAIAQHAQVLFNEGDRVSAHKLALRGSKLFPGSIGSIHCHNLVVKIEAKETSVHTERIWNDPAPTIQVRYRNLEEVHFRLIPYDFEKRVQAQNWSPENFDSNERKTILGRKPVLEWSGKLPETRDFQSREEAFPAPLDLKPGFYALVTSHRKDFKDTENKLHLTGIWVSDIVLVTRNRQGDGILDGFVLEAKSGEPIKGANVSAWGFVNNNRKNRIKIEETSTDKNGFWRMKTGNSNVIFVASHKERLISTANNYRAHTNRNVPRPYERSTFFTDRSLYRPGQTIQFKGIAYRVDQHNDNYKVIPNRDITVVFSDRNNQEIARSQHRSNEFGSFSGSFTAPRDRLMGRMRIRTVNAPSGTASINVEEYKRPKFQVDLDPPKVAAKLGGFVKLQGKATAYTGAAINDAKVKYRIVRNVRYPDWWGWRYWWRPRPNTGNQEISHGSVRTGPDGTFDIEFTAKPDPSVLEKDEPVFTYTIHADVTDTTGETRSDSHSIRLGYTTIQATLSHGPWLTTDKPVSLGLSTSTLDGEPQISEGILKIHGLKQPDKVQRARMRQPYYHWNRFGGGDQPKPKPDLSSIDKWENGEVVHEEGWTTPREGTKTFTPKLPVGAYRAVVETEDPFGKKVPAMATFQVLDPDAQKFGIRIPNFLGSPIHAVEPGKEYTAVWGTGYAKGRAFIEVEHRGKVVQGYWTAPGRTQVQIRQKVIESMRGGFTLRVTFVRENRAYLNSRQVDVPWTNKNLNVRWERFTSKLEPGKKETWTAVITGTDARATVAEMVAGLYDASLDAYKSHGWMNRFNVFRRDHSRVSSRFNNQPRSLQYFQGRWNSRHKGINFNYRQFPGEITANLWGYQYSRGGVLKKAHSANLNGARLSSLSGAAPLMEMADGVAAEPQVASMRSLTSTGYGDRAVNFTSAAGGGAEGGGAPKGPDLSKVAARKNLDETAFFFPHLVSSKKGEVRLEFSMPEALTEWKFLGFTHDAELRSGYIGGTVVTSKDIMVQPNPPRFLREDDRLEFTVKVSNQSDKKQKGSVRLTFAEARTGKSVDAKLGNLNTDLAFDIPAKQSKSLAWLIRVPDSLGPVTYKAVGATEKLSDGEEGIVPVLSRRILVTESIPLPIRGPKTRKFNFAKLLASGASNTIEHKNLSLQVTSNPAWYAVMALPYLMEFPHQCTEQTFNRLYANSLAQHIAGSDPKIRRIFDQWKGTKTLDSPLEKNQDIKAVLLEETPWVRQAKKESEARRNVGILFDNNRLDAETRRLHNKLAQMQHADGAWPWFAGGRGNDYITLYITTGYGRMRHLGLDINPQPAIKALNRLDKWIDKRYRGHKHLDGNNLSTTVALYLYTRSFFLKERPIPKNAKEAVDYYLGQAREHWLGLAHRQSQAHLAIALQRFGDKKVPKGIVKSIRQRAVHDPELGMFWRDLEESWWWYRAPIETQAMMIEMFDEVAEDEKAVEDCKVWLLKQKQTQDWKTTKATADAIYALILRGTDLLASDELVQATLGKQVIKPEAVEAGTGFYQARFVGPEIQPKLGNVTLKKVDKGVAWGSLHWQYLEDIAKITPHTDTPLTLVKKLFIKENTAKGPVLQPVKGPVSVGDELVVRIELRTDRDLEYVHMKDHRGSGTEPVNVLSRYKWQDGLGYYESTRDTASHFYIDYLRKGVYVFEYSVRVQHRGQYQTGMAQIQCMYAPEFNSHSQSIGLVVK